MMENLLIAPPLKSPKQRGTQSKSVFGWLESNQQLTPTGSQPVKIQHQADGNH
jgi:hypothetical protein